MNQNFKKKALRHIVVPEPQQKLFFTGPILVESVVVVVLTLQHLIPRFARETREDFHFFDRQVIGHAFDTFKTVRHARARAQKVNRQVIGHGNGNAMRCKGRCPITCLSQIAMSDYMPVPFRRTSK